MPRREPFLAPTIAASTPGDYPLPRPRPGAPNVVMIVLDDLGFGQLGCFGSGLETPTIDRLAAGGLRYNRFHVTAICSPTRACLLTGRNHHAVGMGFLTDLPMAFPGYTARIPKSAVPLPRILRDAGYNTVAVGKWHLVPGGERGYAGPFDRWPLGFGFERFYGFLQGDTNQWAPNLVRDNHYVDPPRSPADGYHLSEDLADQAVRYVTELHQAAPDRPFFLYFAPGATHSPHHVAPEWVEPYLGRFDGGWERWREDVFARQVELGVVPEGTTLGPRPSWIAEWDSLPAAERGMLARQQEVFAGFLTHTDAQIGRLVSQLERLGVLDDTLVMVLSDNGASAEGGVLGTFNEHRFTEHVPDTAETNAAWNDELGGVRTYPHYSWGWAWAGNTPLRLWKRYTWLGGCRTPLVVHHPNGFRARGVVRSQFVHAIDLAPTILELAGIAPPAVVDGVTQQPVDGASIGATFDGADAPDPRRVQYFEMLGSRSIYVDGWKATTDHVSRGVMDEERLVEGSRDFAHDRWELFDLTSDFAEAHDVAAEHPDVLRDLQERWIAEAGRNNVFPMVDELISRISAMMPLPNPPGARNAYRPEGGPVPDDSVPRMFAGVRIAADVTVPSAGGAGVLCAMGDWNGGFALYVLDGRLVYAVSRAGDPATVASDADLPPGDHLLGCVYTPGPAPRITLLCDDEVVAEGALPFPLPVVWQHGGTSLFLGEDRGLPVSTDYEVPFRWNGELREVVVEAGVDLRRPSPGEVRAAVHSE
ncbi:MAG TPA: arylsulfatase [Acidimicrobiia bacterium]|nr:arylsulfatase [Acidimicrobiia bacterium]